MYLSMRQFPLLGMGENNDSAYFQDGRNALESAWSNLMPAPAIAVATAPPSYLEEDLGKYVSIIMRPLIRERNRLDTLYKNLTEQISRLDRDGNYKEAHRYYAYRNGVIGERLDRVENEMRKLIYIMDGVDYDDLKMMANLAQSGNIFISKKFMDWRRNR